MSYRGGSLAWRPVKVENPSNGPSDSRALVPCKFFISGNCLRGSSCAFSHDVKPEHGGVLATQAFQATTETLDQDDTEPENFGRTLGGAFVTFEDGGRVSKVTLLGDYSAVHLSNLPAKSSANTVKYLLDNYGFNVSEQSIRLMPQENGLVGANIQQDDPTFSKKLCANMSTLVGTSRDTRLIKATPVAARMPSGHTSGRVDCKKVHVSWHKALRTVWLNFNNRGSATRVSRKFNSGAYLVGGQKVQASAPTGPPPTRGYIKGVWTVVLSDVPDSQDIHDILKYPDTPSHIELGKLAYNIDDDHATASIRSLLTKHASVEYWETSLQSSAKRVKATARFFDETDAREVATKLDGADLPFHKAGKLTAKLVYSAKFKVRTDIYKAIISRTNTHVARWAQNYVSFHAYPTSSMIKIEGESQVEVAAAKSVLDGILSGILIRNSGQVPLWDPSLSQNGPLWQAVKRLQKDLGVVVVRNQTKQELCLFGTDHQCKEAQKQLNTLVEGWNKSSSTLSIALDTTQFHWACRGGFNSIVETFGSDEVTLDIVAKKIVVSGSQRDYEIISALVSGCQLISNRQKSDATAKSSVMDICCVCWTEAESPVRTACGHIYCQDCLENSCAAVSASGSDFVLLCHGEHENCKQALGLKELQQHLSSSVFENLLERSFMCYVRYVPNKLRYCPTPDCSYIYRTTEKGNTHTCPNCLQLTCSACYEPHVNMTCAEYKDLKSGGYAAFEKLKKEIGIKDCPKCKTPIEKTEGCNHMTCVACQTHICWVCMKTFSAPHPTYVHLVKMHGGCFDLEPGMGL